LRINWRHWESDETTNKFLEEKKQEFGNYPNYIKTLIDADMKGKISLNKTAALKDRKLEVEIELKEMQIKKMEIELLFDQTFDKTPSSQAKKAIKDAVNSESFNAPEEKDLVEIINRHWNKFIDTLRKNAKQEWVLTCKLCSTGLILPTQEKAVERFKKHLEETHSEELVKIV